MKLSALNRSALLSFACLLICCFFAPGLEAQTPTSQTSNPIEKNQNRERITFLLGATFNPEDPIYHEAFKYYCNHETQKTEYIITHCRSLLEVRNYLAANPTSNGLSWETINLVVQGTDGQALNTSIFPQGATANLRNLLQAIEQEQFPALTTRQVDANTTLHLHGVKAENPTLLRALSLLLFDQKAKDKAPVLACSPAILRFDALASNGIE